MITRIAACAALTLTIAPTLALAEGFGEPERWNDYFGILDGVEVPSTGDFDNDGKADIVAFSRGSGAVYVSRSSGTAFGGAELWHSWFARGDELPMVGNFDGTGGDDIILFRRDAMGLGSERGDVYVALSNGSSFAPSEKWHDELGRSTELPMIGDVDGDGLDDVILFVQDTWGWAGRGDVYVARSTGSSFAPAQKWHDDFATGGVVPQVGDFDGDGATDIAGFVRSAADSDAYADVVVALSDGASFGETGVWNTYFGQSSELPFIADVDADGCDDIGVAVRDTWHGPGQGNIYVAFAVCAPDPMFSTTSFLGTRLWHTGFGVTVQPAFGTVREDVVATGDVDGDGLVDLVSFAQAGFAGDEAGDVMVARNAAATPQEPLARAEDFGFGVMNVHGTPAQGLRPLMSIMVDFSDERFDAGRDATYFRHVMFGLDRSVNGFFWENSVGQFGWRDAGIHGPFTARDRSSTTVDESMYLCATARTDACKAAGNSERTFRAEAIALAAEHGVRFEDYDTNHDGIVREDELTIFVWLAEPAANTGASVRHAGCVQVPADRPGGYVNVCGKVPGASEGATLLDVTHELVHILQGDRSIELYGSSCYSSRASVMSCTGGDFGIRHLDAWHKMQLGWVRPRVFPLDSPGSCQFLRAAQMAGPTPLVEKEPVLLYDRRRGTGEYFLLENREAGPYGPGTPSTYDADATTAGALVWHIRQEADHRPVRVPSQVISPGENQVLDTTVPTGSDDRTLDRDGDSNLDWLTAGADRIVQSVPAGDDVRPFEPWIWTVGRGTSALALGIVDPWDASEGIFTLRWSDESEAEVVLAVANTSEPGRVALRWSWHSFDVMRSLWRMSSAERACHSTFFTLASPLGPYGSPYGSPSGWPTLWPAVPTETGHW